MNLRRFFLLAMIIAMVLFMITQYFVTDFILRDGIQEILKMNDGSSMQMTADSADYRQISNDLLRRYLLYVVAFLLGACILIYRFFSKRLIDRLETLVKQIQDITKSRDESRRTKIDGSDEIHTLSESLNELLGALHSSNKQLNENERFLGAVINGVPTGLYLLDADTGAVVKINEHALSLLHTTREQVEGKIWETEICANYGQKQFSHQHQETSVYRRNVHPAIDREIPVLESVTKIQRDGKDYILGALTDVSELEQTNKRLKASQELLEQRVEERTERLSSIIETVMNGIIVFDLDGKITTINHSAQEIFGIAAEDALGTHVADLLDEPYKRFVKKGLKRRRPGTKATILGTRHTLEGQRLDGSSYSVEVSIERTQIDGRPHFVAVIRDISAELVFQQQIQSERDRLNYILETSPVGVGIFNNHIARYANSAMNRMGVSVGQQVTRLFHDSRDHEEVGKLLFPDGYCSNYEMLVRGHASPFPVLMTAYSFNHEGEQSNIVWCVDISDRKAVELELSESRARYQALIEELGSKFLIFSHTNKGVFTFISESVETLLGIKKENVIGSNWQDMLDWEQYEVERAKAYYREFEKGEDTFKQFELSFSSGYGKRRTIQVTAHPIRSPEGELISVNGLAEDISDRKHIERQLEENRIKYERLVEELGTKFLVFSHTPDGKFLYCSEGFRTVFGIDPESLIGETWAGNLKWLGDSVETAWSQVQKFLDNPEHDFNQFEMSFIGPGGDERILLISHHPVRDDNGVVISVDGLGEDITERKLAEIELSNAKIAAEDASRVKADFLANMSHEIRTPLNAIIGLTHLSIQAGLEKKQYGYISKVHRSAENLLGIINDILDFSKIEAGKIELERVEFNLEDIFEHVANIIGLKVEETGLELMFDIPVDLNSMLIGDPLRLGQVLLNFGSNAAKFTEKGEIVIGVRQDQSEQYRAGYHFWIRDTGIGMTDEQINRLFTEFSQADTSTSRKFGGTGLGLTISKKIIELMDGELWVDSKSGQGSTFHFSVNFEQQQGQTPRLYDENSLDQLRILVVDDNRSAREILQEILTSFGFSVDMCESAEQALAILSDVNRQPYDLVLMDWKLQDMSGVDICRQVIDKANAPTLPRVVLLTAYAREDAVNAASEIPQIVQVISKPILPSALLNSILSAMGKKALHKARKHKLSDDISRVKQGLSGAKILLVEDNPINQEVATELLENCGIIVSLAQNGKEAVQRVTEESFDGVLMDCQLPIMDGYEATKQIRHNPKFSALPIIAMTANVLAGDKEKSIEAGMNDHIGKPVNPTELFSVIGRWITPSSPTAFSPTQSLGIPAVPELPNINGLDTEKGLAVIQDNHSLYVRLLLQFADSYQSFSTDISQAIETEDHESTLRLVHSLKSSAGNIGATGIFTAAAEIEHQLRSKTLDEINSSVIENLILMVAAMVSHIIEYQRSISTSEEIAAQSPADVIELLDSIDKLLSDDDTEALDLIMNLEQLIGSKRYTPAFRTFARTAENYDFEDAARQLAALRETLLNQD